MKRQLFVTTVMVLLTGAVHAHPSGEPSCGGSAHLVTVREAASFQTAINALGRQTKSAFVVEGAPLHIVLLPKEVAKISLDGAADAVINSVARAYDYEVLRDSKGTRAQADVYVLQKRYSDPHDLPDVTFEECERTLGDVRKILAQYALQPPLHGKMSDFIVGFAQTLTLQQKEQIKLGLPVKDLRPEQQQQMQRFVLELYVASPMREVENVIREMSEVKTADVVNKGGAVGIETKTKYGPFFRPLSKIWSRPASSPSIRTPVKLPPLTERMTLREAFAAVEKRSPLYPIVVDRTLADKTVSVFGAASARPDSLARALASVYDLRLVRASDDSPTRVTTPKLRIPQNLSELFPCIRAALPTIVRRATRDGQFSATLARQTAAVGLAEGQRLDEQADGYRNASGKIGAEAARRLNESLTTAVSKPQSRVSFAALAPETRAQFALIVMANLLSTINTQPTDGPPLYVRDFEQGTIRLRKLPPRFGIGGVVELSVQSPRHTGIGFQAAIDVPDKGQFSW